MKKKRKLSHKEVQLVSWCVYHKIRSWDKVQTAINLAIAMRGLSKDAVEKSFSAWANKTLKGLTKKRF